MKNESREIEELDARLSDKLQSQETRDRVISIVCDSNEVDEKITKICDERLKNLENKLEIKKLRNIMQGVQFWIPTALATVVSIVSIVISVVS